MIGVCALLAVAFFAAFVFTLAWPFVILMGICLLAYGAFVARHVW